MDYRNDVFHPLIQNFFSAIVTKVKTPFIKLNIFNNYNHFQPVYIALYIKLYLTYIMNQRRGLIFLDTHAVSL